MPDVWECRRFVLLEHDHPVRHWDFLIEDGSGLASWRLSEFPAPENRVPATALPVHRRLYLDYEGPVSGNRGMVTRRDAGYLCLDRAWPHVSQWPGLRFRMQNSTVAAGCRLEQISENCLYWVFD